MMMVTRLVPQLIPTIPTIPEPCLTKAEMMTVTPMVVMVMVAMLDMTRVNAKEEYYMRAWVCTKTYGIGWHWLDVCISLDEKIKEKGGIVVLARFAERRELQRGSQAKISS